MLQMLEPVLRQELQLPTTSNNVGANVTKLDDFYKFLAAKLSHKRHFGLFLIMSLLCVKCVTTFWAILGEIRQLFIPSSGHTGWSSKI